MTQDQKFILAIVVLADIAYSKDITLEIARDLADTAYKQLIKEGLKSEQIRSQIDD